MLQKVNYTNAGLSEICSRCYSYRQVLSELGLAEAGGNYRTLKLKIKEFNIDISHFTHQGWNKGNTPNPTKPISVYLNNEQWIASYKLKKRLLKENIFTHQCMNCFGKEWLDKPIPLELHHIDGNNQNNSLNNLQLLCPNCHSLTDNYRGKNKK